MASATLRQLFADQHPLAAPAPAPLSLPAVEDDYEWVYDDPDLAPFLASRRERKETPLTAFA